MLDKGPFAEKPLTSMDDILTRMQAQQQQKSTQQRAPALAPGFAGQSAAHAVKCRSLPL
jgi:hypothetical protein